MTGDKKRLEFAAYVRDYEVGADGITTAASIANYLQDAAGKHADIMEFSAQRLLDDGIAWVLTRLRIKIERYPNFHENIIIKTWPSVFTKRVASRDYCIADLDGNDIVHATSNWITFDLNERKMVELPGYVLEAHPQNAERSLEFEARSIAKLKGDTEEKSFNVRESDIDYNNHVNNVHFIEWAVEAIPSSERNGHRLQDIDVLFRAEGKLGDTVISKCSKLDAENGKEYIHSLVRQDDNTELARIKTVWEA